MPKYGNAFRDMLSFQCDTDTREKLVALAYLRGDAGSYAGVARQILRRAVEDFIVQLDPQETKDFKKILDNVRSQTLLSRSMREEKEREKLKKMKNQPFS